MEPLVGECPPTHAEVGLYLSWSTPGTQRVYQGVWLEPDGIKELGSSNYLCLHNRPDFLTVTPALQGGSRAGLDPGAGGGGGSNPPSHFNLCSLCVWSATELQLELEQGCGYSCGPGQNLPFLEFLKGFFFHC